VKVKSSSDPWPTTSPLGKPRFDGIYECRGLSTVGSAGGFPGTPFSTPPTQVNLCYFLKFDRSGVVHYQPGQEPLSTEQAVQRFEKWQDDPVYDARGRYELDGSTIRFNIESENFAIRSTTIRVTFDAVVYEDHLSLWEEGHSGRRTYLEFRFVRYPPTH
jgi:hypothetical protein